MTESQRSISAHELRGILGGSYKTYWFAMHRIRVAMPSRLEPVDGRRDAAVDESRLRRERSARDRRAYVGEQRWRELNDRNPGVFRDTIVALLRCGGVSYGSLTGHRTVTTC
jgi:hypothetical protein